jgi:uncharacterized protein
MSQQFNDSQPRPAAPIIQPEYSQQERSLLLRIAHEAILCLLERREVSLPTISPHLSELRGVFTTLYSNGDLRGCVGFPSPVVPLYKAVIETARAAASEDHRFPPVHLYEARNLRISLSVLSTLMPISAHEVEVGRHGLVISASGRRGLLLPQVPVEHGWDRLVFLEQTCVKAGLPPDAWQKNARIEAFTAEVFDDVGT